MMAILADAISAIPLTVAVAVHAFWALTLSERGVRIVMLGAAPSFGRPLTKTSRRWKDPQSPRAFLSWLTMTQP
jgi:hypothetical protein